MFRFFLVVPLLLVTNSVYAATKISQEEMARDLGSIIASRASIDHLSGTGRTYVAFTRQYLRDLDTFTRKYITPFHVLALRPTIDRSLAYHLRIQQYKLSCEIVALQIVLASLQIEVTEDDIIASVPQYPYIYASGGIW